MPPHVHLLDSPVALSYYFSLTPCFKYQLLCVCVWKRGLWAVLWPGNGLYFGARFIGSKSGPPTPCARNIFKLDSTYTEERKTKIWFQGQAVTNIASNIK